MGDQVEILLVDDDRNDVDIALRAVRRENLNVRVTVANGGGEALEMLGIERNDQGAPRVAPRVVFLDLKMPGVDGWEVLQRLREHPATQRLPVVVLSWSGQRSDVERCYELGANSYVVKRIEVTRPGAYFAEAVRYWVDLNESPDLD
jgi:two-component system response regulator